LENLTFKKIFPFAEKRGARFVGIVGSNELNNNQIQIKNMTTKEQFMIDLKDTDSIVKILKA